MANPEDEKRDQILRFLYNHHKTTRGIKKIPLGIRDIQSSMKKQHGMKQQEVSSNLDYLVQAGWIREVVKDRTFKTNKGMEVSQEQVKYKVSDTAIRAMEEGTVFKKPETKIILGDEQTFFVNGFLFLDANNKITLESGCMRV